MNRINNKNDKIKTNKIKRYLLLFIILIILLLSVFIPYNIIFTKADTSADEVQSMNEELSNTILPEYGEIESSEEVLDESNLNNNEIKNEISLEINNETNNEINNEVIPVTNTIQNSVDVVNGVISNEISNNVENFIKNEITNNIVSNTTVDNKVISNEIINEIKTLNNDTAVIDDDAILLADPTLTATLWDTNQYAAGTGTKLTDSGVEINGWQYETSKYLQIDPGVPADGNTYFVSVILPEEFYIVGTELTLPAGYQSVDFEKNEDIKINDGTTITLNAYSGTAKYTLNNMGVSGTIQIELGYDVRLWDKQAGSSITSSDVKPIKITLSKIEQDGTAVVLNEVSVSKVTAGTGIIDAMSMTGKIEGEANTNSAPTVPKDKKIDLIHGVNNNSGSARYKFYPSVTMTISVPYYTHTDGTKYYLPIDLSTLKFPSLESTSYTVDSSNLESSGTITVKFTNAYWNTSTICTVTGGPLLDELLALDVNDYRFTNGKILITATGKNGNSGITYSSTPIITIIYQKETLEKVTSSATDKTVTIVERPDEAVSLLGGFYLSNTGTGDSCGKNIEIVFDNNNTNKIKVTTYNSFADTVQEYILINYTLVDENGDKVYLDSSGNRVSEETDGAIGEWTYNMKNSFYNSTTKANLRNKLTRAMLPEEQRGYYFKTISYRLEKIASQTTLVATSASATLAGAGNYCGYVDDVNGTNGEVITSTFVVKSDNTSIADITRNVKTTLQTTSNPTYTVDSLAMTKTTIQAGESVVASGTVSAVTYPYGNCTWIKGIVIAAILPKDVSVNEQSISLTYSNGSSITGYIIETQDLGNGNILWKIKLPSEVYIGVANENLGNLSTGVNIKFKMQLDTAYTMNGATLFAKDIFYTAGYHQANAAGGSYSWAKYQDIYDLNENGSTTDAIAGARSSTTASCQVVSQTATLDITDSITIERQGSVTQESNEDIILLENDIVNYNLDIGCFSGGRAEGFAYYIPVPKTTTVTDNFLIEDGKTGKFDFNLKETVSLSGSDIFNIEYAFEEGLTYAEAQEYTSWYTAEQIESDDTLLFENVSMIRLTVKENGIQNGDESRITAKFVYSGENFIADVGMQNIWHSGGFYKHINSDRESAGNFATDGASITINYEMNNLDELLLTAAKNMTPIISGNSNTDVLEKTNFPEFKNAHTFSVSDVETYNVNLETKEYILANTDMPGIDANRTFGITVKTENGEEKDILSTASITPIEIGSIQINSSPEFTFKIYNADAITDNSQTRYIVVTLKSDNGLIIKQKININREIAGASDPKSAIVAGERYLTFDDTSSEVVISQDSAFTAQFIVEYIPDIYSSQELIFSDTLPSGTSVILENLTDEANPTYWYYDVGILGTSKIAFDNFICMGKTGTDKYVLPTGIDIVEEKILVLVDFSKCTSYLAENSYTIKMKLTGQSGVDDFDSGDLSFVVKDKNSYVLNDISNSVLGEEFEINYSLSLSQGASSKYEGRKLALIISAKDLVPSDISLTYLNTVYYLNSKDEFIIPLGDIINTSNTLKLIMSSNIVPEKDMTYTFDAELWVSATANHEAPKLGEKIDSKSFIVSQESIVKPSLKVKSMESRIIHKDNLSLLNTATYEYIPVDGCTVTVELQQKIGTAYQKVTDRLNQVNNTTLHDMGKFSLSPTSGTNKIEFKLSSATTNSTYRLVFKVYDSNGNVLLDVPYNFIVVD